MACLQLARKLTRHRYLEHEKLRAIPNTNINLLRPSMVGLLDSDRLGRSD